MDMYGTDSLEMDFSIPDDVIMVEIIDKENSIVDVAIDMPRLLYAEIINCTDVQYLEDIARLVTHQISKLKSDQSNRMSEWNVLGDK